MNYELNLSLEELEKRNHPDYMVVKTFLKNDAPEYLALADGDKNALRYLVRAANILQDINLRLDHPDNIAFREFLDTEIKNGNRRAELTKIIFLGQKGIIALDTESNEVNLARGFQKLPGRGVYPRDLAISEFHNILKDMLDRGQIEDVRAILNQRSVVERDGVHLKAVDYIDFFAAEFSEIADLLDMAADVSTNADFNEYLKLQAVALRTADPMLDAYADKKWAELQDTPLEFTITRENYADEMSQTVLENPELKSLLAAHDIEAIGKDFLGLRVGIVNKKSTEKLLEIKKYLPMLAKHMPFKDEYVQNIGANDIKQAMVDVDLVQLSGNVGEYRGGITVAENLPNNDKLSFSIGGGRRNVYHRQIRFVSDPAHIQKRLDAIVVPEQHGFYDEEADHWFTIGHENAHSLGPLSGTENLGKYKNIIEENKADVGAIAFLDLLTELGMYSKEEADRIAFTFIIRLFAKSKPSFSNAHRVRAVMQNKYFFDRGVWELRDGLIFIHQDKIIPAAKEMLAEAVRIQIDCDIARAEKYVNDNFVWTDEMEIVAGHLRSVDKTLHGRLETELADFLTRADI
jgi:hypothetical protein